MTNKFRLVTLFIFVFGPIGAPHASAQSNVGSRIELERALALRSQIASQTPDRSFDRSAELARECIEKHRLLYSVVRQRYEDERKLYSEYLMRYKLLDSQKTTNERCIKQDNGSIACQATVANEKITFYRLLLLNYSADLTRLSEEMQSILARTNMCGRKFPSSLPPTEPIMRITSWAPRDF